MLKHRKYAAIGGIAGLVITAAAAAGCGVSTGGSTNSSTPPPAASHAASSSAPATHAAAPPPQYTTSQQSAITAANQYLSLGSGFSKAGLIQQLDSSAGNGFSVADATFAVNHVSVNWDHQAALAAKGYMQSVGGFSYNSMVQQLQSSAGSGFTHAQAVFGAKSVGLAP